MPKSDAASTAKATAKTPLTPEDWIKAAEQVLIDKSTEPFAKLLRDSVLTPIGMTHSTYEQLLPQAFQDFAATPYRGDGKPVEGGAHTYPEMAAAGLWTTPSDLARYAIEVEQSLEGKANHVLSVEMTRQMLTPGIGHWGLGVEIGGTISNPYFSHGGANERPQVVRTPDVPEWPVFAGAPGLHFEALIVGDDCIKKER